MKITISNHVYEIDTSNWSQEFVAKALEYAMGVKLSRVAASETTELARHKARQALATAMSEGRWERNGGSADPATKALFGASFMTRLFPDKAIRRAKATAWAADPAVAPEPLRAAIAAIVAAVNVEVDVDSL
jgi:hypothetical protein